MGTTRSGAIIVVTDLSRHGLRALKDASALAAATSSPLVVATHADLAPMRRDGAPEETDLARALGDHVVGVAHRPIERVVLDGEPVESVERLAELRRARAVVVASPIGRRRIPLRRSLAEQLVRTSCGPLLVTARTDAPLRDDVLEVTAELTESSSGLEWAARLAWLGHTRVLACFLGDETDPVPPMERPIRLAGAPPLRRAREALLERLRPFEVAVYPDDVHLFPLAPERAIASLADRHDADLVVLACRRRTAVQHFVLSNVASRVIAKTRCAVLALPLDEMAEPRPTRLAAAPRPVSAAPLALEGERRH
jgi:nucleotide-binding universal stress UspA family protein